MQRERSGNVHPNSPLPGQVRKGWGTVQAGSRGGKSGSPGARGWVGGLLRGGLCLRLQVHQLLREELAKAKTLEAVAAVSQELKLRCQARVGPVDARWVGGGSTVTEALLRFCRRTCPGRRKGRSPQAACPSFTGSASPTCGQGELPGGARGWTDTATLPHPSRGPLTSLQGTLRFSHLSPLVLVDWSWGQEADPWVSPGFSEAGPCCHLGPPPSLGLRGSDPGVRSPKSWPTCQPSPRGPGAGCPPLCPLPFPFRPKEGSKENRGACSKRALEEEEGGTEVLSKHKHKQRLRNPRKTFDPSLKRKLLLPPGRGAAFPRGALSTPCLPRPRGGTVMLRAHPDLPVLLPQQSTQGATSAGTQR